MLQIKQIQWNEKLKRAPTFFKDELFGSAPGVLQEAHASFGL